MTDQAGDRFDSSDHNARRKLGGPAALEIEDVVEARRDERHLLAEHRSPQTADVAKVLDMVETAKKILSYYDEKAKAGNLRPADARQLAFDAIGAMRWGQYGDYIGIYGAGTDNAGVTYVHGNPKYINVNRWDFRDSQGRLLIRDLVEKARAGGPHRTPASRAGAPAG